MLESEPAADPADDPGEARRPELAGRPESKPDRRTVEEIVRDLIEQGGPFITKGTLTGIRFGGNLPGILALTPEERAAVERILEAAAARLEDVYATPGDDGRSWYEHAGDPDGDPIGHMAAFVPGTAETFAGAAARIREAAIAEACETLSEGKHDAVRALAETQLGEPPLASGVFGGLYDLERGRRPVRVRAASAS